MGGWTSQYPKDKHIVVVGAGEYFLKNLFSSSAKEVPITLEHGWAAWPRR